MISYGKQSISQEDIIALIEVLKGDFLTQGSHVQKFEEDLKEYFGAKFSCAVSSGTAALHLSGLALGWGQDDIVITTPLTFLATANCIVYAGATPDFVDIDPATYTIDPNLVEEKVKVYQSKGIKVKAIIGVDYAGHPCDWLALRTIADKYELQLVNDNCHALGASYHGDKQYAVKYVDIMTQSYHPVKHITTGEGGAAFTDNSKLYEKINELRSHGMVRDRSKLKKNDGPWYYEMHEVGYNYRITDFQCALGSNQLKKLDFFVQKRRKIAKKYDQSFSNFDKLKTPEIINSVRHSYHLYPLQVDFDKTQYDKKQFFNKMKKIGVNLQVHYIPVHLQPFYQNVYGFKSGDFPISESFFRKEVSLPIYPGLSSDNVLMVINNVSEIIDN